MNFSNKLNLKLIYIFNLLFSQLSNDKRIEILAADKKILLGISQQEIILPFKSQLEVLFKHKSFLEDKFINNDLLTVFIDKLRKIEAIKMLNHIGFCYKVDSQKEERERLKKAVAQTNWSLYEMDSTDEGLWLFVGNNKNWQDSLIELLPVESTKDQYSQYWLPHIHIDINTGSTTEEIEKFTNEVFKGEIKPYPLSIYSVRLRLGVIGGINIMLDLGTDKKNTKYSREHLLKKL